MLGPFHLPALERAVRDLVPRAPEILLTDAQWNALKQLWNILIFGLFRSALPFLALFYLPVETFSRDALSGLIHFMFALWILSFSFQLASSIRGELCHSNTATLLTILPATAKTRVDAVIREHFWFLAGLPIELLAWHLVTAFTLKLPSLSTQAFTSLAMCALIVVSTTVFLLRYVSRIPSLSTWLNVTCALLMIIGFVEGIVRKRISVSYGIEDLIHFIGRHLAILAEIIPMGWFYRSSVGLEVHPIHWLGGFALIVSAAFLFKQAYRKLAGLSERHVAEMEEIDLELLFLDEEDLDVYLEELAEAEALARDPEMTQETLISNALIPPTPETVIPGESLENSLVRRNLDAEDCQFLEAFYQYPASSRSKVIRAWILVALVVAGQFFSGLPIEPFWMLFAQMACSVFAILSVTRFNSGLTAAYAANGPAKNSSAMVTHFPVTGGKLSELRMKLVSTFSLIHLPPVLFVISAYWLFHFNPFSVSQLLIGGVSFALFGITAFLLLQWYTTAILLLKMGRSFFDFTLFGSLVLFICLNFGWCLVIARFFSFEFQAGWIHFFTFGIIQSAVCAIVYLIGLRRLRKPSVDLWGRN